MGPYDYAREEHEAAEADERAHGRRVRIGTEYVDEDDVPALSDLEPSDFE